ncbi:hypothetical protein RI367_000484 [Sorochytrium milnesiophthora]
MLIASLPLLMLLSVLPATRSRGMPILQAEQTSAIMAVSQTMRMDPIVAAATTVILVDASGSLAEFVLRAESDDHTRSVLLSSQIHALTMSAGNTCAWDTTSPSCHNAISNLIATIKALI